MQRVHQLDSLALDHAAATLVADGVLAAAKAVDVRCRINRSAYIAAPPDTYMETTLRNSNINAP